LINKKIINSIIFFIIIAISLTSNAISVSVSSVCKNNIKSYNFDSFTYDPDFKIVFSSTTFNPDLTVKVVDSKDLADIVIEDLADIVIEDLADIVIEDLADIVIEDLADIVIEVCESENGDTVKILNYGYDPDFTVKILNYGYETPDLTIFNNSKILSTEEAISTLIVPNYSILDLNKLFDKKTE
jgi:hypothetical protein